MRIHIVQKGDTLWKIAKQYGVDFEELKRVNRHLSNPDYILPGMEIYLPDGSSHNPNPGTTRPRGEVSNNPTNNQNQQKSSKEQLTMPIEEIVLPPEAQKVVSQSTKEQLTAPIQQKPSTKEQLTAPIQQKPSTKEKLTQPIKEIKPPKEVETAPKPVEMKPPIMPQFHFDFAPQFHHQPVQPQPMPMPQPQPIFIEMPQQQQPIYIEMPQQHVEQVKEKEYVPVQQPHYVYIPYFLGYVPCYDPCFDMMHYDPCDCHHEHKPPCPCEMMQPQFIPQYGMAPVPPMMPYMSEHDSSEYVAPQVDLSKVEEGLPDWLEKDSSSSSKRQLKSTQSKSKVTSYYDDSSSIDIHIHHDKKKTKHRSESYPYMNPNPYSPWNF